MKNLIRVASLFIGFGLVGINASAAEDSFIPGTPPPEGATIQDDIGDAADQALGVWTGNIWGRFTPCEVRINDYYYDSGSSSNPIKIRALSVEVVSTDTAEYNGLMLVAGDEFVQQKGQKRITIDQSDTADGFGAILRQYSKIKLKMKNGQPASAHAEEGSIQLSVLVEKRVDINCVNLKK